MNHNITPDTLIQYLDNELDPDYRLYVESQIASNPEVQQLLERLRTAREAVVQYARKETVAGVHKQVMEERKQQRPVIKTNWLRSSLRAAAIILVLLIIGGVVQYSLLDSDRLYSKLYQQYTISNPRDDASASLFQQAYRKGDMKLVASLYENKTGGYPNEHFLAGQAYLAIDNPEKAVAAFDAQLNANASLQFKPYQDASEYYLALAYLKAGNTGKALPLFEKIHRETSHAYNKEVSGWFLQQLRWLKAKQS